MKQFIVKEPDVDRLLELLSDVGIIEEIKETEKEEIIPVPGNIKFERDPNSDKISILFNEDKQVLEYKDIHGGIYFVNYSGTVGNKEEFIIKVGLKKIKANELKPGDFFIRNLEDKIYANKYYFYISDTVAVYISCQEDVIVSKGPIDIQDVYKVVPIE